MLSLDHNVVSFLNGFVNRSWTVDEVVWLVATNALPKVAMAVFIWWTWFGDSSNRTKHRQALISAIVGCLLGVIVARTIAFLLPFRERPLHNPALHLAWPQVVPAQTLISWSSFPSDHAALFFGLAAGFFFISLSAGALAMAWALVGVAFARMYLGFHYPSDILGGAVVGVATTLLANVARFRPAIAEPVLRWEADRPRCFYAGMFTFVFLFGTDFGSVSEIVKFGLAVSRHAVFHAQLVH